MSNVFIPASIRDKAIRDTLIAIVKQLSNGNVTIEIFLSNPELLNLKITNLQGQQVDLIDLGMTESGQQFVNYNSSVLPSGQYFVSIFGGNVNLTFSLIKE